MEKPNKIIKANGGKKKTSRSKRKKGFVYYKGDTDDRSWDNSDLKEPSSAGWLEWKSEGYVYALYLEKFRKLFNLYKGAERGIIPPKESEIQIFKTRFFEMKYPHYSKYLILQGGIIKHAEEIGLWNDKVAKKIGGLIPLETLEKAEKGKDEIQAYLCFRALLKQVSFIANAARHIIVRFTEDDLTSWYDDFEGTPYVDYGIDRFQPFESDPKLCEKAQMCLDWFIENNEFLEDIYSDINWLVDEMGMVCGELSNHPECYWEKWDSEEHRAFEFYQCIDERNTFGLELTNDFQEGGVRLWSFALQALLDPEATIPIKSHLSRITNTKYKIKDLIEKDFPKAKQLLNKIDIVKYRKWLLEIKGELDGVTLERHKSNFNHYDNLAEKLHWAEDQIFNIGFNDTYCDKNSVDQWEEREHFLGEFIESLEQVEKWGSDEEAGDLAQIQRYYFEKKTAPKGKVIERTAKAKLWGQDEKSSLLERLSDAIENVSPEYGGCVMGDITIVWEGTAIWRGRKDKKGNVTRKLTAPLADDLREHIAAVAKDAPHGSFKQKTQYGLKPALSPAWQKIFDVLPVQASKEMDAWLIDRTSVDEKGKIIDGSDPSPIKYRMFHGRTKHKANCSEVAQYLIDHCDQRELERRLDNHLNLVKSKQKKSAS